MRKLEIVVSVPNAGKWECTLDSDDQHQREFWIDVAINHRFKLYCQRKEIWESKPCER